ncbi:hypothetical protein KPL76_07215 [Subtercola sp. PAMC28395]|uniref:hypothetical protein n=1 Tax=Subtercola sp. PAMC28395 TaxID=2846775 RepID=UPI001C0E0F4D|nr:hypothetical protein [Subtercola sp. PAMC28395]QWT25125.1 hypothetical protein KPL76_07215 [Subtercola sp. PAMC28395]
MNTRFARTAVALILASIAGLGLAGCSGNSAGTAATPVVTPSASSSGSTLIAPIVVNLSSVNGQVVTVGLNNVVDLNTGATIVTNWRGEVADPTIAKFVEGHIDGGATFNPGITPLAVGASTVTVTNRITGFRTTFDLVVTQ